MLSAGEITFKAGDMSPDLTAAFLSKTAHSALVMLPLGLKYPFSSPAAIPSLTAFATDPEAQLFMAGLSLNRARYCSDFSLGISVSPANISRTLPAITTACSLVTASSGLKPPSGYPCIIPSAATDSTSPANHSLVLKSLNRLTWETCGTSPKTLDSITAIWALVIFPSGLKVCLPAPVTISFEARIPTS